MKRSKCFIVIIVSLIIVNVNLIFAQANTTATGYKIGSAKKQIYPDNTYSFFSNTSDFGVSIGNQTTATVIARSCWYFDVPSWILSESQVYKVEFTYTTYNNFGFFVKYISSLPNNPSYQEIWDGAGNGSNVGYFPGSSGQQYTYDVTSSLVNIVQNAVSSSNKRIKLGFISATETSNVLSTTLFYLGLKIYYNRPVSFTVRNNFNAGVLSVNGNSNFSSGGTVNTWETFINTFQAIEPQSNVGVNYLWNDTEGAVNKSKWERKKSGSTTEKGTTQSISPTAVYDDNGAEFVAYMRPFYNIQFHNYFVGVNGFGGSIIVNGTQYDAPTYSFPVVELNSITATAQNQTINGIQYTFSQWSNRKYICNHNIYYKCFQ